MLTISHVNVWVHDQDEALDFYTRKLGFEVRDDVTVEEFDLRWLTVGPPSQPELRLILSQPGAPQLDEETGEQVRTLMARGALGGGGIVILHADDVQATYEELSERGVEFVQPPMERPYGIDAAFRDPSGNPIRITQPV